jgi:hypothetical protein
MASYDSVVELMQLLRQRGDSFAIGYLQGMLCSHVSEEDIRASIDWNINTFENKEVTP